MSMLATQYQDVQTLTVTGLPALANGASVESPAQTSGDWMDYLVKVTATTSASAVAKGTITVSVSDSIDDADYGDANNRRVIGAIVLPATGAGTYAGTFLVSDAGTLPPYWKLAFRNATGDALAGATVKYRGLRKQTQESDPGQVSFSSGFSSGFS